MPQTFKNKYQHMKRLLSFFTLVVVAMCCYADQKNYYVDGFKYLADPDTKEATLIYNENKYSGDVVIPASFTADGIEFKVTALGDKCFYNCCGITSITIPEGVKTLGNDCFHNCYKMKMIEIPSTVTSLGEECFKGCSVISEIKVPYGVTNLSSECFSYCEKLTSLSIPSSVTQIGQYCFAFCKSLSNITLPASIKKIVYDCFWTCPSLSNITCLATTPPTLIDEFDNRVYSFYNSITFPCVLYVPDVDAYKAAAGWNDFPYIYKIKDGDDQSSDKQKCEKPIISFASGKLLFSDATKGAEYHYTLSCADVKNNEAIDNGIVDLAASYDIEVYATADGYSASDNATATLYWVKDDGKIGTDINTAKTRGLVVSSDQGLVTCSGLNDGEQALFYSTEGKLLGRQTAQGGSAGIATQEKVIIVKVGATSIKARVNQ